MISSLLDVDLSRDRSTAAATQQAAWWWYLYPPVRFADNARCRFAIVQNGFPQVFSEATWIHCREVSYNVFSSV